MPAPESMKIEFDLLSNALDSLQQAVELVAWPEREDEARRLKSAIQAITHGIELLLKERLRRVHPCLVWENVDKYPNPNARTVTAEIAISRLINAAKVDFTPEDHLLLRNLRSMRNAIEHFTWSTTKNEADALIGQALEFAFHFARTELNYELFGYHTRRDDTYQSLIKSNKALSIALAKRAFSPQSDRKLLLECDFCRARAVEPKTFVCAICGEYSDPNRDENRPF